MPSWLPQRWVLGFQRFRSKHSYVIEHVRKMDLRSQYGIWHQGPLAKNTQLPPLPPLPGSLLPPGLTDSRLTCSPPPGSMPLSSPTNRTSPLDLVEKQRTVAASNRSVVPVSAKHKRQQWFTVPFVNTSVVAYDVHDSFYGGKWILSLRYRDYFTGCARNKRFSRGISLR